MSPLLLLLLVLLLLQLLLLVLLLLLLSPELLHIICAQLLRTDGGLGHSHCKQQQASSSTVLVCLQDDFENKHLLCSACSRSALACYCKSCKNAKCAVLAEQCKTVTGLHSDASVIQGCL
jgi:hypothetical protein